MMECFGHEAWTLPHNCNVHGPFLTSISLYLLQVGDMGLSANTLNNQSAKWKALPLGETLRLLNVSWNPQLLGLPKLCPDLLWDLQLYEL